MQTMEVEPESLRCSLARLEKHVRPGALGCREGPRGERLPPALWGWRLASALGKIALPTKQELGLPGPSAGGRQAAFSLGFFSLKTANPQTQYWVVSAWLLLFSPLYQKLKFKWCVF